MDNDLIARLTCSLAGTSLCSTARAFADLEIPQPARRALKKEFSQLKLKPAAVLVGILPGLSGSSIVLTRRSEALRNHPGQISFPGGSMDAGDSSLDVTALRESYEEINLPEALVNIIGYLPDYPTVTGYRVTPVVGLIDAAAVDVMAPDGVEATELIHLPVEYALDRASYEKKFIERNGINLPVYHLAHGKHDVWGATAGMLYQLCLHFERHENTG